MSAVLKNYPDGMGGMITCYTAPMNVRDANEWLNRIGALNRGFKLSSTAGNTFYLSIWGQKVLKVQLKNNGSVLPICQIASQIYGLSIDFWNPIHWSERFTPGNNIVIQKLDVAK